MEQEKIEDPFILELMRLTGIKQEELKTIFDFEKLVANIKYSEYAYLIGNIRYLLLKSTLDKKMNRDLSEEEMKNYCENEQSKKSYPLRKIVRYLLPEPFKIQVASDDDILPKIEEIMLEIKEMYESGKHFGVLSENEIRRCLNLQLYKNYYDCIEGTQNYLRLKNIGIEEYRQRKKDKLEKKHEGSFSK